MHFDGEQTINAPIETVWDYFMDPNKVAQCAPGFQGMEILDPNHFKPTVAVGIGAVKAKFTLDVTFSGLRPPNHADGAARGNAAGSAVEVQGGMDLEAESETVTKMRWAADVTVNGTLASVGARLMESTARKLTGRFFDCTRQQLESPTTATTAPPSTEASEE